MEGMTAAIVVATQSLHTSAPSVSYLFTHHLSLLKHHSAATRRESLSYLTTHLPNALHHATSSPSPASSSRIPAMATIVTALTPLILDSSQQVRAHLLALVKLLPREQVAMYIPKILLFVHSAMTHITEDIRADSTKFLEWAIGVDREGAFGGGGWGNSLKGITGCLGWSGGGVKAVVPKGKETKVILQHLGVLKAVLEAGLAGGENAEKEYGRARSSGLLHGSLEAYMIPNKSNVYAYLNLFSAPPANSSGIDGEGTAGSGMMTMVGEPEDEDSRRRYLISGPGKGVLSVLEMGLSSLKKDGGEVGRVAGKLLTHLGEWLEKQSVE